MADLDRLSIQIEANTRGATNQIGKLADKLSALTSVIDKIDSSKFEGLAKATNSLAEGLSGLKGSTVKQIAKVGKALDEIKSNDNTFTNVVEGAKDLGENSEKATTDIYNILGALKSGGESTVFQSVNKQLEEFSEKALTSESSVKGLKGMLASLKIIIPTQELDKTQKKFEKIKEKAQELAEQMDFKSKTVEGYVDSKAMEADKAKLEGLINEIERLKLKKEELESHGGFAFNTGSLEKVKKVFSEIGTNITKTTSKILKFVSSFAGIPWVINATSRAAKKLKSHFDNLGKSIGRIYKMARLMLVRKVLQAVIKNALTGFTNLIQYSGKFDASVSLLWNSMRQLGNSVAAAVAPLINALAPALNLIIQLCIKAVNAINQLISALMGGGTWIKAKTLSDDYAKSLKKASGNAKDLKKSILGFDEINKLDDNSSSGGGLTQPTDMFETSTIEDKWRNFSNKLKDMWRSADFSELGRILGDKIKSALDNIPWNSVKRTAKKLAKSLATFINGFIETENIGTSIGRTLAESLNTAFEFLNKFIKTLHWSSIGKFIAETFNGFFENIDWELVKETVLNGVNGLISSIGNFMATFNWDNISNSLSNVVNTLSEAIYTFFSEMNFAELGKKIGTQLRKTIESIDWRELGKALGSVIQSAFDFVQSTLKSIGWGNIKKAISDIFEGIFEEVDKSELASVIATVIGISVTMSVSKLIANIVGLGLGKKIAEALFSDVGIKALATFGKIGAILVGLTTAVTSFVSMWKNGWSAIKTVIEAIGIALATIGAILLGAPAAVAAVVAGIVFAISQIAIVVHDNWDVIKDFFVGLWDGIKDIWENISSWFNTNIIEPVVSAWEGFYTRVLALFQNLWNIVKAIWIVASTWFNSTVITPIINFFSPIVEKIGGFFKKAWENIKSVWSGVTSWFSKTILDPLKSTFNTALNFISSAFNRLWDGVKSGVKGAMNSVLGIVEKMINGIIEGINSFISKINVVSRLASKITGDSVSSIELIPKISLPRFANGGFPEDGLFMANHGEMVGKFSNGKTAVANNEQITDGIAKAVYSAIVSANSQSGSGQYINNTIQIDGETIARAVTKGQNSINRRYSPTMA